ncbi:PKD domain-containing protein [Pedobacter sp. KR3-3]|uniref:PKD domain-containing protein n=1 Tax=Pedobacter albus TaxID=3113905 RepID=A0ABU7I316_9SPHI|nr:PKD domain-containing protein [Pedobacter sp. KR3-3]MEE1943862.1 PKD domain-containing protein [Pedobacter sp. KR3-3]
MKNFCLLVLLFLLFGPFKKASAQNISNEGTDFWAVFPTHVPSGNSLANMVVFISSKDNSSGKVIVGGQTFNFTVKANSIAQVAIPRNLAYIDDINAGKVLTNKGIHIVVDAGKPKVAVYAHIYATARSEAYLVLPLESHGKRYYAMSIDGQGAPNTSVKNGIGGMSFLTVVATEDDTHINIKKPQSATVEKVDLPKAGDVYEMLTDLDLTGTLVEIDETASSCKTMAVYSGHSGLALNMGSYDPLLQQLYPIASWGRTYGVVPFYKRASFFKILPSEDNTTIKVNGVVVAQINLGDVYKIERSNDAMIIQADHPISVAQFTYSQDEIAASFTDNLLGDPDMVILNPIEYNIKNITVFSSNLEAIRNKYINIFMKTNARASFKVNGKIPTEDWQTLSYDPTYSYIQIEVFDQSLTLSADDGFNAIAYGFGNHESYAYSAGTNLATSQFLTIKNRVTNAEGSSACIGQPSDFKLTLPYLLTRIVWKAEDGSILFDDQNPTPTQSVVSGQTLYTYLAPVNKTFDTVGQFKLSALASFPKGAGSCFSGEIELLFNNINIDPLPKADFTVAAAGCADKEIAFTDKSISNVAQKSITKWQWDFGDNSPVATEQNPKHTYQTDGVFTIKLFVGAENGCLSDVVENKITIYPKIKPKFDARLTTCINTDVSFKDQSTITSGNIVKWTWDMGDQKGTLQKTNAFNYKYDTPGEYTVTLVAESDKGCTATYTQKITVTILPTSDFVLPAVCLADAQAAFANNSTDFDGTTTNLTYLWNFGDPTSGILNTSTQKDGKHKYNAVGNYNVTLTVFNGNGCSVSLVKPFVVNGSSPKADFVVGSNLCSNQAFSATNAATVDFGSITRIEWYIDGVKYSEDENPSPGKQYDFSYPAFTAPLTKTIMLEMVAYSGGVCSNRASKPVVLLASPVVTFNTLAPLCFNTPVTQLEASEASGLSGTGVFSGDGVMADGQFNPRIAGVGKHSITYTFTATNGCVDSKTQVIEVYPIPTAGTEPDVYVFIGGQKELKATASGAGLSYKWTPSTGLSSDVVLNPIASPQVDTKYTLTVTSNQGCSETSEVWVHVLQNIEAPSSFSPNGDGINDVWNIKYLDTYPNATVEIFDRNGQKVYFSKGYAVPFDGNYNNKALPVGTYYYVISPNNGRKSVTGALTIIR